MSDGSPKNDAELISTDGLIEELRSRFSSSVFIGIKPDRHDDTDNILIRWAGGGHICIGMLYDCIRGIHRKIEEGRTRIDD